MANGGKPSLAGIALAGAYLALAWLALLSLGPSDVTLIWPATGVAYAATLYFGPRSWPFTAICVLLVHLLLAPVEPGFLPWSIAGNVAGVLAGTWAVRHVVPDALSRFDIPAGAALLGGGVLLATCSALIAGTGLWVSGQSTAASLPSDMLRWAMGDLFGIVALTPATLLALRKLDRDTRNNETRPIYAGTTERIAMLCVAALALALIATPGGLHENYALATAGLPLGILIWCAARLPPRIVAYANAAMALLLATAATLGLGGFPPPSSPADATMLAAFLCVIATIPMALSMGMQQGRQASARLLQRANRDALTGSLSRGAFERRARTAMQPGHPPMALAYIDLDRFRLINDALSHEAGDELLCAIAGVLRTQLTPADLLARLGGDEFALLLQDVTPEAAQARAQALCTAVSEFRFRAGGHMAAATISLGLVHVEAASGTDFGTLLALADTACFAAKERGGNRVQTASPGAHDAVRESSESMRWALRLGHALEMDHFQLHCQAIMPLNSAGDTSRHFEILLRLAEPGTPLVLPSQFIGAAERFGLATRLDRHVLDKTLHWFARHPEHAAQVGLCAINLSAASLQDDDLLEHLARRLETSPLRASQLCFELTETCALSDLSRAQRFIAAARALGCRFALDDFGTGFCSFGYLQSLEVDYFKIDGSFVREIVQSPLAYVIVRSIADIGRVMRKRTIAECTESEEIRQRLADLGVDYSQGYALHRPTPIDRYFGTDIRRAVSG